MNVTISPGAAGFAEELSAVLVGVVTAAVAVTPTSSVDEKVVVPRGFRAGAAKAGVKTGVDIFTAPMIVTTGPGAC